MRSTFSAIALVLVLSSVADAQLELSPDGSEADPFVFAERVRARGDEPILDALRDSSKLGRSARRRAIRASVDLREPSAALPMLVSIAASREPFDAEAAMHAAFTLVRAMPGDAVERYELDREALRAVVEALRGLAADESARPDLRTMAGIAAIELRDRID